MKRLSGSRLHDGEGVPAIIARHVSLFVLAGVLIAQLLLLSTQITRNHNIKLIHIWTAMALGPLECGFHDALGMPASVWGAVHDLRADHQDSRNLGSELVEARFRIHQLSEQAAEADQLRSLLDFKSQLPYRTVAAEVIASSPGAASRTVSIDRGADAGLTPDLPVITPQGVAGKITAVYPHTSQVLLITDSESGVGCMLAKSRTQGILKGSDRSLCSLAYIMDDEKIETGDPVITSGLDQIYPKGLLVGYVQHAKDGNIYKDIQIRPAVALSRLENVLILQKVQPGQRQAMNTGP